MPLAPDFLILTTSLTAFAVSLLSTSTHTKPGDTCQVQPKCCFFMKPSLILQEELWCAMSVIPAFRKLRQEDQEFESSLGYIYSKVSSQEEKMIDLKVAASADRGVWYSLLMSRPRVSP